MGGKEANNEPLGELDLVFAFDCTASMGAHLQQAQANVRTIAREIAAAERASVRMALVAYRDHPPEDRSFVRLNIDVGAFALVLENVIRYHGCVSQILDLSDDRCDGY